MDSDRQLGDFLRSGRFHGIVGAGTMFVFANAAVIGGFPNPLKEHPLLLILISPVLGWFVGLGIGRLTLEGSGRTAQRVYMPNAWGTYVKQHSNIDALEATGRYREAVDAWEKVAIAEPSNPWPLIRAGELYLRTLEEPQMALDRFRAAREVPGAHAEQQMYASQKVIDLYLGPLNDRGRGLVELRRFVHVHAGTREAQFARDAIAKLKSEDAAE